jgi:hypothetical protein
MTRTPRWRSLLEQRDAALGALLGDTALALRSRPRELARWSSLAGLPEGETLASPFGARMIALGLEAGATTVHHELRPLLRWHRSVRPDGAVADPAHGLWVRGALRTGKYEEFCAEDPFISHHPEHSAKWAPHEMLHRAVGFFAREGASGFSRYLGARLNELLPVATWYGLEHALRLDREGPFDRAREGAEIEAPISLARWLTEPERSLRARARRAAPLLRWTLERTARELAAIDAEIATGALLASPDVHLESFPDVRLDASADALAYVHAHSRRLACVAVSNPLDRLAIQRVPTVAALRARIDTILDRLLFAEIALDPGEIERRIHTNVLLDRLLRAGVVAPAMDSSALVTRARRLAARHLTPQAIALFTTALTEQLTEHVGVRVARAASCLGLSSRLPIASLDTRALERGLGEVVPETARALGRDGRRAIVGRLVAAPARGHLALRVRAAIAGLSDGSDPTVLLALSELARLEHLLDTPAVREPREAWRIQARRAPPHARVSLRSGIRIERFEHDVLALHRGEAPPRRVVHAAIGHVGADVLLCELPAPIANALGTGASGALGALARRIGRDALDELEAIGVLVVLPPP